MTDGTPQEMLVESLGHTSKMDYFSSKDANSEDTTTLRVDKSHPEDKKPSKVEIEVLPSSCLICESTTGGTSYDIYTTLTVNSMCLLSEFISKTSQIIFDRDKVWSATVCRRCYGLLIQLDEAEIEFSNLKSEFLTIINKNSRINELAKKVVSSSVQTEGLYPGKIEFCSVEVKDEFDDYASVGEPFPLLDTDSDDEPLVRNKLKREKTIKTEHNIKEEKTSDLDCIPLEEFGCRECLNRFTTRAQVAVHAFSVHRIDPAKDPAIITVGPPEDKGRKRRSKKKSKRKSYIDLDSGNDFEDDDVDWVATKGSKNKGKKGSIGKLLSKPIQVKVTNERHTKPIKTAFQLQKKFSSTSLTIKKVHNTPQTKGVTTRPIPVKPGITLSKKDRITVKGPNPTAVLSTLQEAGLQVSSTSAADKKPKEMLPCPDCPSMFSTKARLDFHMVKHAASKSPFICEICGASYKHKKACDIHVGMHKGISPWKCSECGKIFPSKGALSRHEAIHTGKPNYQACQTGGPQDGTAATMKKPQPILCDLCGKSFIHTSSFKMHKLSHTGVKPHSCSKCGLALMTRSHLKRHQRVHSGEKRHECLVCGKKFSERYNLYAHQKSHESLAGTIQRQAKNHDCTVCDATFNRRYILEKHMETAHQRIADTGPKRPRNTMTKLLKQQAGQARPPGMSPDSVGEDLYTHASAIDLQEVKIPVPSPITPVVQINTDSTSSTIIGENQYQQQSGSVLIPVPKIEHDVPPGPEPPAPHPWQGLVNYHLANDYPLRMHGVDYAGYLNRQ